MLSVDKKQEYKLKQRRRVIHMKMNNKWTKGVLFTASALLLGACATETGTNGSLEEDVASFDAIQQGELEMNYSVSSKTYGDYEVKLTGEFVNHDELEDNKQAKASGLVSKVNATELEEEGEPEAVEEETEAVDGEEEAVESQDAEVTSEDAELEEPVEGSEEADVTSELVEDAGVSPSRGYDYALLEETSVYVDGQETNSSGEVMGVGENLYDKVYLTGSEADGKYVYDSRDAGVMEYPVHDYLHIDPIISSFDLGEDAVSSGDLANDEKGNIFTLTPEEVTTALQENEITSELGNNILGLVSEVGVDKVIIGVNETTFSVEAISTGTGDSNEEPTSEATDTDEEATEETEESVLGYLTVKKTAGDVDIKAPTGALDLDEFSAIVELFYQDMAEQQASQAEFDFEDGEINPEEAQNQDGEIQEIELTAEEVEQLENGEITLEELGVEGVEFDELQEVEEPATEEGSEE